MNLKQENAVFRKMVEGIDDKIVVDSYFVTTKDYYKLKLFRLTMPEKFKEPGPPVLF